jgi:hypothetical protein
VAGPLISVSSKLALLSLSALLLLAVTSPAVASDAVPPSESQSRTAAPRVRLLVQSGLSSYDNSSWLGGTFSVGGRVAGAVWFVAGAGVETRPESQVTTSAGRVTVPATFGFRRVAELPQGIELRGGGDFVLMLEEGLSPDSTERVLRPRPGGLLEMGLAVPLAARVALDLAVSLGAVVREQPSKVDDLPPLIGPEPRFQLRLGVRFGIPAKNR